MRVDDIVNYFGSKANAARALGVTRGAITNWDKIVPASALWRVEKATGGRIKPDPALYQRRAEALAKKLSVANKRARRKRAARKAG
jgi:hypothetical protein